MRTILVGLLWLCVVLFNGAIASCHDDAEPSTLTAAVPQSELMKGAMPLSMLPIVAVDISPEHPCQDCDGQCSVSCSSVTAVPVIAFISYPDASPDFHSLLVATALSGYPLGLLRPPSALMS